MPTKRVAVKKKKALKKKVAKIELRQELHLPIPPVPILREALICAIDDPKRWAQPGTVAARYKDDLKAMNVFAEIAADLNRGDRCFFCDGKQSPTPAEDVYRFNPGIALCECLAPFRKVAFDYIENWDSEEGKKYILAQVDGGKIALDTPVYQYFCQCGQQVIVDVRTVAFGLRKHHKHSRRRLCNGCYQKIAQKRAQSRAPAAPLTASRPKDGPHAKINKIKQTKKKGPAERSFPPLEALEKKAPEAPATA